MVYRILSNISCIIFIPFPFIPKQNLNPKLQKGQFHVSPLSGQGTLGAGHLALLASDPRASHLCGNGESLECALGAVVVVVAVEAVDMKCDAGTLGEALEAVGDHLAAQFSEKLALEAEVDNAVRAVGKIDDGAGEGLVKGSVGIAVTGETGGGAESLGEGDTKGYAHIFGSVVVVNCQKGL